MSAELGTPLAVAGLAALPAAPGAPPATGDELFAWERWRPFGCFGLLIVDAGVSHAL